LAHRAGNDAAMIDVAARWAAKRIGRAFGHDVYQLADASGGR